MNPLVLPRSFVMEHMDQKERAFLEQALELLRREAPDIAAALENDLARTLGVASMARNFPSLLPPAPPDESVRSAMTIIDVLCQAEAGRSALSLPIRAVMGETFLTAKIQLFQAFRQALQEVRDRAPAALLEDADREVAQSIYTMLLAELLRDIVRYKENPLELRQRAATELVRMWDNPDQLEIDDIFPVLEAAWQARHRISVIYGALVGVSEFFQLLRENCPPDFVSFFTHQDVSPDENAAFQEFLFGLPQEELRRLREAMKEQGVPVIDRKFAEDTLKLSSSAGDRTPEALFASFHRRQSAAQLRRLTGAPGPRNTAEAYLVLHVLRQRQQHGETPPGGHS